MNKKRLYSYLAFVLLLAIITIINNDGEIYKGGMLFYYAACIICCLCFFLVDLFRQQMKILPMTGAFYEAILYLLALFVYVQRMIGGVEIIDYKANELNPAKNMSNTLLTLLGAVAICIVVSLLMKNFADELTLPIGAGCILLVVLILFAAHFAPPVNHAHIKLFGILVMLFIIPMVPMAVGFFVSNKALNRINDKRTIRIGPIALFAWIGICCLLAVLNNDLGFILLIGGAVGLVILSELRGKIIKYMLVALALCAVIFLYLTSSSVRNRFDQAFSPYHVAYETVPDELWEKLNNNPKSLETEERTMLIAAQNAQKQLTRNKGLFTNGWYGAGYGSVTVSDNPERNNDYVIQSMGIEMGILFLFAFILFSYTFAIYLYHIAYSAGESPFQVGVMKTATWLFIIPIIYIPLSNFGILPLTGISYPFMAAGKAVFWAYAALAGIIGGILEKNHNHWNSFIE